MLEPPKKLLLCEVPAYIKARHGLDFTRVAVYQWAKAAGKDGAQLRTVAAPRTKTGRYAIIMFTFSIWVDDFLRQRKHI